jgi:hypothetical protein
LKETYDAINQVHHKSKESVTETNVDYCRNELISKEITGVAKSRSEKRVQKNIPLNNFELVRYS